MPVECIKKQEGKVVCKFSGYMDTKTCLEVERDVMNSVESARSIVFDLDGVEYIDSTFLRLCGKAYYKVNAGDFSIINVTPAVKKIFKIAGLAERLNLN